VDKNNNISKTTKVDIIY